MATLHSDIIKLASELPQGDPTRRRLLAAAAAEGKGDKVQVLNENGRKVWVTKETLKGPDAKKYKPIEDKKDKGKGDKPEKSEGGKKDYAKMVADGKKKYKLSDEESKLLTGMLPNVPSDRDAAGEWADNLRNTMMSGLAHIDSEEDANDDEKKTLGRIKKQIPGFTMKNRGRADEMLDVAFDMLDEGGHLKGKKAALPSDIIRLASELPQGDPARRKLLAVLQKEKGWMDYLKDTLWPKYKEEHPKSKEPPKSLVEEAKEKAGEGDKGKKDDKPKEKKPEDIDTKDVKAITEFKTKDKGVQKVLDELEGGDLEDAANILSDAHTKARAQSYEETGKYDSTDASKELDALTKKIEKETGFRLLSDGDFAHFEKRGSATRVADAYLTAGRLAPGEKKERWVFTRSELRDPRGLTNDDDWFSATVVDWDTDDEVGVQMYRNGKPTGAFDDGTRGVDRDTMAEAADVSDYWSEVDSEVANNWLDVVVDRKGRFIRFMDDRMNAKLRLATQGKAAGAGRDILYSIIEERPFIKLYREMEKAGDEQSADLLRQITGHLVKALDLSDNEYRALQRLRGCVDNQGRWGADLQRNNIFKAANLLGLKLPSAMF